MSSFDLVIRDAYLHDRDDVVDIAVDGETIEVVGTVSESGETEIDADGDLVSPGLVDCHTHYDWSYSAAGDRRPRGGEVPYDQTVNTKRLREYMSEATQADARESVISGVESAVANGVLHGRTHAYVQSDVGTKDVKGVLEARDALAPTFDLEIVSFPQEGYLNDEGSADATREALELGVDLVGGIDPGSVNEEVEGTIDLWFDLAEEYDVGIDAHLHDPGSLGRFTLGQFAETAVERGFEGRVTGSHVYALGDHSRDTARFPQGDLDYALGAVSDADMSLITCYMSTPTEMPIERIHEHGIDLGHGTDQIQDLWIAHGNASPLQGAMVESIKLDGEEDYYSNPGMRTIWEMITTGSAAVLGIEGYGIEEGTPANLVVHDAPSPEWVIIRQPDCEYVISDGTVVARDGELTTELA
ncbi:MAG: cytosine deaminase [Natronomonas sp.]|jgi:cytosine deaminase